MNVPFYVENYREDNSFDQLIKSHDQVVAVL